MSSLSGIADEMQERFDAKNKAREGAFIACRAAIRDCSAAIRSVHRGQFEEAENLISKARSSLSSAGGLLKDHPDVRYAGFFDDAEVEYAEAKSVYAIIVDHEILMPDKIGVDQINYLLALGDLTGELRRHILDLIRKGRSQEGEFFLEIMEEIFYLLMLFDYPDAVTRGLRRKSDLARSMVERTRGDLTGAIQMEKVELSLRRFEDKINEPDFQ